MQYFISKYVAFRNINVYLQKSNSAIDLYLAGEGLHGNKSVMVTLLACRILGSTSTYNQ